MVYTYFLLYTFLLLVIHCSLIFFDASVTIEVKPNVNSEREVTCDLGNGTCYSYLNLFETEFHIIKGIESAAVVFSFSVFAFALITALLLKCSKRCELIRSQKEKTCLPNNQCSSCNVLILLMLQAIFTCLPRATLVTMLVCFYAYAPEEYPMTDDEENQPPFFKIQTGFFDKDSFFVLGAVCDSIATAMMTPWYLFKKMETKDDPPSVDGTAVKNSEGEGATYLHMTEHA